FEGRVTFVKAPQAGEAAGTAAIEATGSDVIADVRMRGDAALRDYSRKFDGVTPDVIEVSKEEGEAAVAGLNPQTRRDTEFAIVQVRRFAEAQRACLLPLDIE